MNLSPRARRWWIAAAILFGLYTAIGFLVLPPIVKAQAEKRLSAELGRKVSIGRVRLNPYTLSLTVRKFDIREKDGATSFLTWDRLYVNFEALASLRGDWVLGDVALEGFHARVAIVPDGSFNFSDVIAKLSAASAPPVKTPPSAEASRPIRVENLKVTYARVDFSDRSRAQPFDSVIGPVTFALMNFRTAGERGAPYHFEAATEAGEKLAWTGTLSIDPFESRGQFAVENVILKKYTPYFADKIQSDLIAGKLTVSGRYEANLSRQDRTLKLSDGELHLDDLRIAERAKAQPAIELAAFDMTGIQVDAVATKAAIGRIALTGGHVFVRREKDGSLNLLSMLQPPKKAAASNAPAASAAAVSAPAPSMAAAPVKQPDVTVGEVALKGFKIEVTDNAAPRPARFTLSELNFSLNNFSLAEGATMPLKLAFNWAPKGTVQVAGSMMLKPELTFDLKTDVNALAILPLSPYLEQFANARITQGAVTTTNTVQLALPDGAAPAVTLAGEVKIDKFGLVDGVHNEPLAGFAALALTGIKASTTPQLTVSLAELDVTSPYARVIVNADKSINLLAAATPAGAPAATAASPSVAPSPEPASPRVEVARLVMTDGNFSFDDHSLDPGVHMAIAQFGGTISGLSSTNPAKADVDLKGTVDGAGPIAISGKLDPLSADKFVDLKVDFNNVDLLPLSPYAGKYAGYELARGKLLVDTTVRLNDDKLDAKNVVTLNQFTFGAPTNSPDATKLPVRLGVALLKDTAGKIVIDLPVQGSLDDPSFRIGKVVGRVIVNLLTKAAVSPFALIGSMFGGGGEELAFQEFAPGRSELQPAEQPKLETLVKALTNRPGLNLAIEGAYDPAADAYALKRQKLADFVRRQIWETRHAANADTPPPEELVITPEENAAAVKKLFDEKFPPGTPRGTPLPPPPTVEAPPPPPPSGIFKRLVNTLTFKSRREERARKREAEQLKAKHEKAVAVAAATGLPVEEMTGRLAETMEVGDNDLRALAAARAQRVRDYLINTGHISSDRLFLAQNKDAKEAASAGAETVKPGAAIKRGKGPRVFLALQ
jgi:hypothetical protein